MAPVVPAKELKIRGEPLSRYQVRLDPVIRIMDGQELVLITVSSNQLTVRIRGQPVRRPMRRLDPPTTSNHAVEVVEVVVVVEVEDVGVGVAVVLGDGTEITYQDNGYYDAARGSRGGD